MPEKKSTSQSKKSAAPKKEAAKKTAAPAPGLPPKEKPRRRDVWAVVCLFLMVFSFLGYFTSDGWFIKFFRTFLGGIVGRGFYLFPPVFLLCAYILFFHRGRPVRFRVACSLLIPLLVGAALHLFACKTPYEWSWSLFGKLYSDGSAAGAACSGGILGGLLAMGFGALFGIEEEEKSDQRS